MEENGGREAKWISVYCWQEREIGGLELAGLWGWYREMYRKRWTVKAVRMDLRYDGNGSGCCAPALAKIICIFFFSILLHGKPMHDLYLLRNAYTRRDKKVFPSCPLSSLPNRSYTYSGDTKSYFTFQRIFLHTCARVSLYIYVGMGWPGPWTNVRSENPLRNVYDRDECQ